MRSKVAQGFEKVAEGLPYSIVGVVRGRVATQREGGLEGRLVVPQHLQGGCNVRPRRGMHDLINEARMAFTHGSKNRT